MAAPAAAAAAAGKAKALLGKLGGLAKFEALRFGVDSVRDGSFGRKLAMLFLAPVAILLALFLLVLLPFFVISQALGGLNDFVFGDGSTVCPSPQLLEKATGIPAAYLPIYCVAGNQYKVNPYLLASIHKQETGFSTHPTTPAGVNSSGCCAGPMQFNLRAGTWDSHKNAFHPVLEAHADKRLGDAEQIDAAREEFRPYPLDRRELTSCRDVRPEVGCVYDDFDAISAAAHKLAADGANRDLTSDGTHNAVCAYIGSPVTVGPDGARSCVEVDSCTGSINQYCEVIDRAVDWELAALSLMPDGRPGGVAPVGSAPSGGRLAWPTPPQYRSVSSDFGWRTHPIHGGRRLHTGIDISPLPNGTPITAAESGTVTHACENEPPCSGYGNFVCVEHNPGLSTCYAHLESFSAKIKEAFERGKPGEVRVGRGEVIGLSDSTGSSTGPHLHFEVRNGRYNGDPDQAVDPEPWLRPDESVSV